MRFRTGGIREVMGPRDDQMNENTIWRWSRALGQYLEETFSRETGSIRVLVSYDTRRQSRKFAVLTAVALKTYGMDAELLDKISPTPLISFCVGEFLYHAGVMITASHNPKEFNGYKVYWQGGGQVVSPHDKELEDRYRQFSEERAPSEVKESEITTAYTDVLESAYVRSIMSSICVRKRVVLEAMPVVYSSLHGSGYELVKKVLQKANKIELFCEETQCIPNGEFPTVSMPNPEEEKSFEMSIALAQKKNVSLIVITDGDADRLGVAVRKSTQRSTEYQILDGNQQAALLLDWYMRTVGEDHVGPNPFVVKTIPTTSMFKKIAMQWNVDCETVPTGFKNISSKIIELREQGKTFCLAAEESCGFLFGSHCLDKDGILAAWAFVHMGLTSMEQYLELTQRYEYMVFDKVIGVSLQGKSPSFLQEIEDFLLEHPTIMYMSERDIDFPVEFGKIYVRVRSSGTEEKIKFYFTKRAIICTTIEEYEKREKQVQEEIGSIMESVKNL